MKSFKRLTEELLNEGGGDSMPADDMTISELKIACYAANNILDKLENGAMIQRWQISAIVKAKEELASVYTSISADEIDSDEDDMWDDEEEDEPMYVGFEYPSMYGEEVELHENPWNQRGQKKPGTEELPAPAKGSVEKHGKKFKEGDTVVPHTGPHAGVPHKVTFARAGSVNILPMVSIRDHKYDNTTIRAKHEHLSPYKQSVKEEVELDEKAMSSKDLARAAAKANDEAAPKSKVTLKRAPWETKTEAASYRDIGARNMMKADQKAEREVAKMRAQATKRAEKEATKKKPVEEDINLDEAMYVKTTPGQLEKAADKVGATWDKEKNAYIKNGLQVGYTKLKSKPGEARSYDHFIHHKLKEETDYKVTVDGLPDMYVKADSPGQVKNSLRKVVKNPEMIKNIERIAKSSLQKMFRDKAAGKEETGE